MIFLLLSILSSATISIVLRFGENKIENKMAMFIVNYGVCAALSYAFSAGAGIALNNTEGAGSVVLFGVISGILYLVSFVFLQKNISENGVVLSATFMRLGVLIPTLMAIIVFREIPTFIQILGIIVAIIAIIYFNYKKQDSQQSENKVMLLALLFCSGITDSMANIYNKLGNPLLKDQYLLFTFIIALCGAFILWKKKQQSFSRNDVLFGVCIGVPNYFSSRFLLGALRELPAVIVYPVCNVAVIIIVSLAGLFLFKEDLSQRKKLALCMIILAIVLLNI